MKAGRLAQQVALITGATTGIGRATAWAMATEGADIAINGLPTAQAREEAEQLQAEINALGQRAVICLADVSDRDQVEAMFTLAIEHFGRIGIVLANAGLNIKQNVVDTTWDDAQKILGVCLNGVYHTCQLGAAHMIEQHKSGGHGGKILITGSIHANMAVARHGVYSMCKAATQQLARVLAVELAPYRINVNVVHPGWTDTTNERTFLSETELQQAALSLPWQRLATPAELAAAFVFLASSDADYISGHSLTVDGALQWWRGANV